jgi:RNA polymerase sigma-70 factor (ECF subfamily)
MHFPTTHWSALARASLTGETEARSALSELCQTYWPPLNQFIRLRGYGEAEAADLTQEFLIHLLEHSALRKPDPLRGRFRSFLLGALTNFLSHERERRQAQKRGGDHVHVAVDAAIDGEGANALATASDMAEFDRAWAVTVVRTALQQVQKVYCEAGKGDLFGVMRPYLPGGNPPPPYEEASTKAGMSLAAFNSEVHRMRRQFRDCLCAEVARTVSAPHEIDEEIAYLYRVLMDRGTDLRPPES